MLRDLIRKARSDREVLKRTIPTTRDELEEAERRVARAEGWLLGIFLRRSLPARRAAVDAKTAELASQEDRLAGTFVDADFALDEGTTAAYEGLASAFMDLANCGAIWDITNSYANDRFRTRSAAGIDVERKAVRFSTSASANEVLHTEARCLCLQNANGADLVIYPGFVLLQSRQAFALIDLREVTVEFSTCRFLEHERVPRDSRIVGQGWAKSNKDGSPDRRFNGNYQIPWVEYAELQFGSPKGLNEAYLVSSVEKAKAFSLAFSSYQAALRTLSSYSPVQPATSPEPTESSVLPDPASGATPQRAFHLKSTDWLRTRNAVSLDDGKDTLLAFGNLLTKDIESINGREATAAEWNQFVAELASVLPTLRNFLARSPGARALEPVAVLEIGKIVQGLLASLESAFAPKATNDAAFRDLVAAVRNADAGLRQ